MDTGKAKTGNPVVAATTTQRVHGSEESGEGDGDEPRVFNADGETTLNVQVVQLLVAYIENVPPPAADDNLVDYPELIYSISLIEEYFLMLLEEHCGYLDNPITTTAVELLRVGNYLQMPALRRLMRSFIVRRTFGQGPGPAIVTTRKFAVEVPTKCNKNFLARLNKISGFTDEEISEVWLHYDKNQNGTLERAEMKRFMADLFGFGGGKWDDSNCEEAVDRMICRLDTNGDGLIDWSEFWNYVKTQQATEYLKQFNGVNLDTEKIYELWYHYDSSGTGTLEADEMIILIQDIFQLANEQVGSEVDLKSHPELASLLGPNKKVTWDEFCTVVVPLIRSLTSSSSSSSSSGDDEDAKPL